MSFVQNFPFFSIILCLLCAVVTFVVGDRWGRRLTVALLSVSIVLQGCVLWFCAHNNISYAYMMGHFPAPWGNEIMAGVLEPLMALVFSVVMLLSVLGGMRHIEHDIGDGSRALYWVMVDLTLVSLLALCYTNDIFTGYVFIEICTIASCGILCARESGRTLLASMRYMVFSLVGSGLFFIGVVYLYSVTGQLLFPQLLETVGAVWQNGAYRPAVTIAVGLISTGLAIKSGLFPFHTWLPEAHSQASVASSCILSGVIVKGYAFLLIKIIYRAIGPAVYYATGVQNILLVLGLGGMVICSVSAIRARHLKVMVAYSSAAQIGYIFMGIGMGTQAGMLAAILQVINHALTKSMLFLSAVQLSDASQRHMDFPHLRGAGHRDPAAGILFTAGALSMVGVPLFAGFIPKLYFAQEAFSLGWQRWPVLLALVASTVLNVLYFLYTAVLIWLPQEEGCTCRRIKAHWDEKLPAFVLLALGLAMGIHSAPLTALLRQGFALFSRY